MDEDFESEFLGNIDPKELEQAAKVAKEDMKADQVSKINQNAKKSRGHNKEGSAG